MEYSSHQPAQRDILHYDVIIVGAGPAGLSAAIKLKQLSRVNNKDISICVLEKSSTIGAHILSGTVFDPIALTELFPKWKEMNTPVNLQVREDHFLFISKKKSFRIPNYLLPSCFKNTGNYIISLSNLVIWLSQQAEMLGVDIFPGFPASEILYDHTNCVIGIVTASMGLEPNNNPGKQFQPGVEIRAKYTLFSEGARGELAKQLERKLHLRHRSNSQVFSLGLKELWEINPDHHNPGLVTHTIGWPLNQSNYGGGFLYHMDKNQVSIGMVIGLGYKNPYFSPFEEFQRYKTHPVIAQILKEGKRIAYGARAISTGGITALPNLIFPGGAILGCSAGFLNTSRIKGSHSAMESGILAANAVYFSLTNNRMHDLLQDYPNNFKKSWLYQELQKSRNFKQWMNKGLYIGSLMNWVEQGLLKGHFPWTLRHHLGDHQTLKKSSECQPINYPKPDGKLSFDRASSVYLSNIKHRKNQPTHIKILNASTPTKINLDLYAGVETRYCPAGVYEFQKNKKGDFILQVYPENCIHCKTCDIKDPTQNINWTSPEGGNGPNYKNM